MFSKGESLPDTGLIISLSSNWFVSFSTKQRLLFLSVWLCLLSPASGYSGSFRNTTPLVSVRCQFVLIRKNLTGLFGKELQAWFSIVDHEEPPGIAGCYFKGRSFEGLGVGGATDDGVAFGNSIDEPTGLGYGDRGDGERYCSYWYLPILFWAVLHILPSKSDLTIRESVIIGSGVNTFPTYRDKTAYLSIGMQGGNEVTPRDPKISVCIWFPEWLPGWV